MYAYTLPTLSRRNLTHTRTLTHSHLLTHILHPPTLYYRGYVRNRSWHRHSSSHRRQLRAHIRCVQHIHCTVFRWVRVRVRDWGRSRSRRRHWCGFLSRCWNRINRMKFDGFHTFTMHLIYRSSHVLRSITTSLSPSFCLFIRLSLTHSPSFYAHTCMSAYICACFSISLHLHLTHSFNSSHLSLLLPLFSLLSALFCCLFSPVQVPLISHSRAPYCPHWA